MTLHTRTLAAAGLLLAALATPAVALAAPAPDADAAADSEPPPHTLAFPFTSQLSLDLAGEAPAVGLGYENVVARLGGRHRLLVRAGLGYVPTTVNGEPTLGQLVVPVGLRYLLGFGAHHLELGLAFPLRFALGEARFPSDPFGGVSFVPSIGWRYEDFDGGRFFVGAAYTPRITRGMLGLTYGHWARVSVGLRL